MNTTHPPHRRLGRRLLGVAAASIASILALTACSASGAGTAATTSESAVQKGGTLTLAFNQDPYANLDPNQNFSIESRSLDRNLVDSLTDQDPKTGAIKPWLATKWSVSSDAKTYTFWLRKDVTFSDGEKFDATAVKDTLDNVKKLGALASLGATYISGYSSTTVVDPYEVKVDFATPNAAFLQATATTTLGILSPKSYTDFTPAQRALGQFYGSGPFTLKKYTPNQSVVLVKRKDYDWGSPINSNRAAAYIDELDVKYIPEESVLVGALNSGQIDVAWPRNPLSAADQQSIKSGGGSIQSAVLPGLALDLLPNINGILGDDAVRKAIQLGIDRKTWADTVFYPGYPVATSVIDSSTPQYKNESSSLKYNAKAAQQTLSAAGWKTGSDGYRYKDGKQLAVSLLINAPWPGWDLLQSELKAIGIKIVQQVDTPAQFSVDANNGKFDLTGTYFTRGDADILRTYYDTSVVAEGKGPGAYTQKQDVAQKLQSLFAQEIAEPDTAKRTALFGQIQDELIASGTLFPLQNRVQVAGVASTVHGLKFTNEAFLRLNDVWISK